MGWPLNIFCFTEVKVNFKNRNLLLLTVNFKCSIPHSSILFIFAATEVEAKEENYLQYIIGILFFSFFKID